MLLSGLSIGWLVGMSVAPVVQSTITAVLGLVVGILSLAAGLKKWPVIWEDKFPLVAYFSQVSLVPMAAFLIGLSGGAAGGVYTRTNDLLGINPQRIANQWQTPLSDSTTVTDSVQIIKQLFQISYRKPHQRTPADSSSPAFGNIDDAQKTRLFMTRSSNCDDLLNRSGEALRSKLEDEENPLIKLLMTYNPDNAKLEQIKKCLCPLTPISN